MTLNEILQTIHRIYEGNTDYPTSGEEDYDLRVGYVNDAIREWAEAENVKWAQLFKTASGTISGSTITCPSDFVSISSFLKIKDSIYVNKKVDEVMTIIEGNPSAKIFWITGSPGSYVINVNPTPTVGDAYTFYYYKRPATLSSPTDRPEMSKPMFIVYWVLARLYEQDGEISKMSFYEQKAVDKMSEMMLENESPPFNHEFKITDDDPAYKLGGVAFGI